MSKKPAHKHRSDLPHQAASEDLAWLDAAPIGREFGSPDYERLTALDQAAFAAFQSWEKVWEWLASPNSQLDGACPEDASRSPDGFSKIMSMLMVLGGRASKDYMREIERLPVQERDTPKRSR
jgi:hypothetical protein